MLLATLALLPISGCAALTGLLQSSTTRIRLVNNGDFDVAVTLYMSDNQETIESVLTETGTMQEYNVPPGNSVTLSRDCGELQALLIENAALLVIGEVGLETDSEVLRDGDDLYCGDTIVFTFTHSVASVDFDVWSSVKKRSDTSF